MTTVLQVRQRIEGILTANSIGVLSGNEITLAATTLPAGQVEIGPGRRTRESGSELRVSRDFQLWFFAAEITKPDDPATVEAALAVCDPWLDTIPDLFGKYRRLELNDGGIVADTLPMTDSGPVITPWKQKVYGAIRFTLPVILVRPIS